MLDEIRDRIEQEIERLTHELNIELPERIKIAMEHGDLRENSEYKSAKDRQDFVQARLNHLTKRMSELSKIDVKEMAYDKVGFGSRVTVRDLRGGDEETYMLVFGDFIDIETGQKAARVCAINLIAQLRSACGGDLDRVRRVVKIGGFVNGTPDFPNSPQVMNGASDVLVEIFGDAGKHGQHHPHVVANSLAIGNSFLPVQDGRHLVA